MKKLITSIFAITIIALCTVNSAKATIVAISGEFNTAEIDPCCTIWCTDGDICAIIIFKPSTGGGGGVETPRHTAEILSTPKLAISFTDMVRIKTKINGKDAERVRFREGQVLR